MIRSATGIALTIAVLAVGIVGLFGALHRDTSVWGAVGIAALVVVTIQSLAALASGIRRPAVPTAETGSDERPLTRLRLLARQLDHSTASADAYERTLRPTLLAIARQRALDNHGVDLERDPERAEDLLAAATWNLISGPARTAPTAGQLAAAVADIDTIGGTHP